MICSTAMDILAMLTKDLANVDTMQELTMKMNMANLVDPIYVRRKPSVLRERGRQCSAIFTLTWSTSSIYEISALFSAKDNTYQPCQNRKLNKKLEILESRKKKRKEKRS